MNSLRRFWVAVTTLGVLLSQTGGIQAVNQPTVPVPSGESAARSHAPAGAANSPWPMYQRDAHRTSRSPFVGPHQPYLKWNYAIPAGSSSSPAITPDGTLYLGANDNKLHAVKPDGTGKWTFPVSSYIWNSPAIADDGTIYFGHVDYTTGELVALNPNGSLKWGYPVPGVRSSPVISPDGTIYVGSSGARLYAFTPTGSVKWVYQSGFKESYSSPAIGLDGAIYIAGTKEKNMHAVNPNGTTKWTYLIADGTSGEPTCTPTVGDDGTVYIGGYHTFYALNPNGTLKWSYLVGEVVDGMEQSAALGVDGTVYIVSAAGTLYALKPGDGTLKWSYASGAAAYTTPLVDANGTIYFSARNGKVYAINADGSQKWVFQTPSASLLSSIALNSDGTLYVSGAGGLYAIGEAALPGAREGHGWVYDEARQRFIQFGGKNDAQFFNDTWEFDGHAWQRIDVPQAPSPRADFGMVYDSASDRVVLFGGEAGSTVYSDTWTYNPNTQVWEEINTTDAPAERSDLGLVYDEDLDKIVLFGGTDQPDTSSHVFSDTWVLSGTNWVQQSPVDEPSGRTALYSMVYDTQRQRVILHGGWTGSGCSNETWEYTGSNWVLADTSGPARYDHSLAYDRDRGRVIFYGGNDCSVWEDDTREYNPSTGDWTVITEDSNVTAYSAPLVYDPVNNTVVLYGGSDSTGQSLNEVWEYNPTTQGWQDITPGQTPTLVYLPLVMNNFVLKGNASGQVVSAITGQPVSGATVCVVSTNQCNTTNAQGDYSITDIPSGLQTLRASASGYISLDQGITIIAKQTTTQNFALSPSLAQGEIRIVLTWGASPPDLDSHLWLPASQAYHIYYGHRGNCAIFPYACLDVDDRNGYGPETITIKQKHTGTYVYAVYQFSSSGTLTASGARVQVYGSGGLLREFQAPTSGDGRWWYVFDMDGSSGAITSKNTIVSTSPAPYSVYGTEAK